jgi:Flp pilus assembly protein TadD
MAAFRRYGWRLAMRVLGVLVLVAALPAAASVPARAEVQDGWAAYDRGDYAGALAIFSEAAQAGDPEGMYGLGFLYGRGQGVARDDAAAVRWLSQAVAHGHVGAKTSLGYHYDLGLGVARDPRRAERLYEDAVAAGSIMAANNLAYGWSLEGRNLDQALVMMRGVVDASPEEASFLDTLGWVLYRMRRYEEAVPPLCKAAVREAGNPEILTHLGDALWRVGRPIEARQAWGQALALIENPAALSETGADQLRAQGPEPWLAALRPRLAEGLPPDPENAGALPGASSDIPMPDECAALTS